MRRSARPCAWATAARLSWVRATSKRAGTPAKISRAPLLEMATSVEEGPLGARDSAEAAPLGRGPLPTPAAVPRQRQAPGSEALGSVRVARPSRWASAR